MNPPQSIRPGDGSDDDPPKVVDRADLAERRARRAEMGEQMQARRAEEAEALVAELTGELTRAEAEAERSGAAPARMEERLAEARAALRAAEQRAHAERRRRLEASEESAARLSEVRERAARERARADANREALREAQTEGERLRRRVAEAEQAVAAAAAARRRAGPVEKPATPAPPGRGGGFRAEAAHARSAPATLPPPRAAAAPGAPPLGLEAERALVASRPGNSRSDHLLAEAHEIARALAQRLDAQHRVAGGIAELSDELARERAAREQAERALAEQQEVTTRVRDALDGLRAELARLRSQPEPDVQPPPPAIAPPPLPGLAELRERLGDLSGLPPLQAAGRPADLDRLDEARARLRARAETPAEPPAQTEGAPEPNREPGRPADVVPAGPVRAAVPATGADAKPARWLAPAFVRLAAQDPALAGRLAIGLLPALGAVTERPVTFTVDIEGSPPVAVDAGPGSAAVIPGLEPASGRRPEFRLSGSAEALGRFLEAPAVRSWLVPPGRPRLRGRRKRAAVLRGLVRAPLGFAQLAELGVELEPELAYALLARAIAPEWTRGHAFTIRHETTGAETAQAFLTIRDGQVPVARRTVLEGRVAATVACSASALLPLLAGAPLPAGERASIRGEAAAVALVQGWVARAQGLA